MYNNVENFTVHKLHHICHITIHLAKGTYKKVFTWKTSSAKHESFKCRWHLAIIISTFMSKLRPSSTIALLKNQHLYFHLQLMCLCIWKLKRNKKDLRWLSHTNEENSTGFKMNDQNQHHKNEKGRYEERNMAQLGVSKNT